MSTSLTHGQCLDLYTAFLLDTVDRCALLPASCFLFLGDCEMEEAEEVVRSCECHDLQIRIQEGADLGERMWNALCEVSPDFTRTVIVGTDAPSLPLAYVRAAFEALEQYPVVMGPTEDGGYYLLGVQRARQSLFEAIDWGSGHVFSQTLERVSPEEVFILPVWYDVDMPGDLQRLKRDLEYPGEGFARRTHSWLEYFADSEFLQ